MDTQQYASSVNRRVRWNWSVPDFMDSDLGRQIGYLSVS